MTHKRPATKNKKIELEPDAWPRFERFIRSIAKAGPQHRAARKSTNKAQKPKSQTARKKEST